MKRADTLTAGNIAAYRLFAYGDGARTNGSFTQMDGAAVHLDDARAPLGGLGLEQPRRLGSLGDRHDDRERARRRAGHPGGPGRPGDVRKRPVPADRERGRPAQPLRRLPHPPVALPGGPDLLHTYSTEADLNPDAAGVQRVREGANAVGATAYDATGKATSLNPGTLRVDRSRPSAAVSGFSERDLLRGRDYRVEGSGADSVSGVRSVAVTLDGVERARKTTCPAGAGVTCTAAFTLDGSVRSLSEGSHTVQTTTTDLAGNTRTASASFAVELDRDPPSVSVAHEGLEPWLDEAGEVSTTVTGSDAGSGIKSFALDFPQGPDESRDRVCGGIGAGRCKSRDSETFVYATDAGRFTSEGRHSLRAVVTDAGGNATTSDPWQVNVDRSTPGLELSGALYERRGEELGEGSIGSRCSPATVSATRARRPTSARACARWTSCSTGRASSSPSRSVRRAAVPWRDRSSSTPPSIPGAGTWSK